MCKPIEYGPPYHTRSGVTLFIPIWDLSIPVPARGNDKRRTVARRPHASCTMFRDVIVMLKWRHHVASRRIQDFLEVFFMFSYIKWGSLYLVVRKKTNPSIAIFFMFFQYKMRYLVVSKKKNPLFVWEWNRKIRPSRSPFVITRQASWCQSVILGTDFSIPLRLLDTVKSTYRLCAKTPNKRQCWRIQQNQKSYNWSKHSYTCILPCRLHTRS